MVLIGVPLAANSLHSHGVRPFLFLAAITETFVPVSIRNRVPLFNLVTHRRKVLFLRTPSQSTFGLDSNFPRVIY